MTNPPTSTPPGIPPAAASAPTPYPAPHPRTATQLIEDIRRGLPFRGSHAIDVGVLTRHDVYRRFRRILPDVYIRRGAPDREVHLVWAALPWLDGAGVVSGASAATLLGERWFGSTTTCEVTLPRGDSCSRPAGIVVRHGTIQEADVQRLAGGGAQTGAARTAIDLGRRASPRRAVEVIDAFRAGGLTTVHELYACLGRYRGLHGGRRVREAIELSDSGAQSPRETELRLLVTSHFPEG